MKVTNTVHTTKIQNLHNLAYSSTAQD